MKENEPLTGTHSTCLQQPYSLYMDTCDITNPQIVSLKLMMVVQKIPKCPQLHVRGKQVSYMYVTHPNNKLEQC